MGISLPFSLKIVYTNIIMSIQLYSSRNIAPRWVVSNSDNSWCILWSIRAYGQSSCLWWQCTYLVIVGLLVLSFQHSARSFTVQDYDESTYESIRRSYGWRNYWRAGANLVVQLVSVCVSWVLSHIYHSISKLKTTNFVSRGWNASAYESAKPSAQNASSIVGWTKDSSGVERVYILLWALARKCGGHEALL